MERKIVVFVPSDMAGKPINTGLAKAFSGCRVRIVNLLDELVVNYDTVEAERIFRAMKRKIDDFQVVEGEEYYLLAGGAVINSCLVVSWLSKIADLKFLVWERALQKYVVFDREGRRVDDGDSVGFEFEGKKETVSKGNGWGLCL
jgi:hypothetical protein